MDSTADSSSVATILGNPPQALALRIRGTERHGQVVQLHSTKVAIGSSRNCTLRLHAAGVSPWHCLILRGGRQTIVRRYSADTRLNDAAFEDAPLALGDRLAVGPIEFEVIDAALSALEMLTAAEAGQVSEPTPRPHEQSHAAEEISRQLQSERATFAAEKAAFTADRSAWEKAQQIWRLEKQAYESEKQALAARMEALESEREAWEREKQRPSVDARRNDSEATQLQAELAKQHAELQLLQEQLISDRQALLAQRSQFDQEVQASKAEIERLQAELATEREELDRAAVSRQTEPVADITEPAAELVSLEQAEPIALAGHDADDDVFARLRALSLLKEDAAAESSVDSSETEGVEAPPVVDPAPSTAAIPTGEAAEEESISDYMARLLQRMRKADESGPAPRSVAGASSSENRPAKESQGTSESISGPTPAIEMEPKKPLKMAPRKAAPEKSHHLAAMREIANMSARAAIATHHQRRGTNRAWRTSLVAVVGAICGMVLLIMAKGFDSPFFFGGIAALVVAAFWGSKTWLITRHGRISKRHQQQQLAAITREHDDAKPESREAGA